MDEYNKEMILTALGMDIDERNMQFLLANLKVLKIEKVVRAAVDKEDYEKILHIWTDQQEHYAFLLTETGSVVAVQNVDTAEWVIRSVL